MPIRRRTRRAASLSGDERSAKRRSMPVSPRGDASRWAPATGCVPEEPDPFRLCFERDPRPDQALAAVAPAGGQVPGVHRAGRRPPPHPAHARGRGRAGRDRHRARAGLCEPLTEAIALAHDCGHGPAGHASEEAFSPYLPAATTTRCTAPT